MLTVFEIAVLSFVLIFFGCCLLFCTYNIYAFLSPAPEITTTEGKPSDNII